MFSRILSNNVGQSAVRASRMSTKPHWPSSTYKTTTGLVGLAVDTNARNTLLQLTDECLKSVQRAPVDSGYRIKVEEWMHFIDKSVKMTDDIKKIEDYIDLGQIEEVIEMVKDEIELSEAYVESKGWELCDEAESHATEWYEFKNEDLHFQGLTDDIEEQNKKI